MKHLIGEQDIRTEVAALGQRISLDYHGQPLTVLGVLKGSVVLLADLMRSMEVPHRIGFVRASSYSGKTTSAGLLTTDLSDLPEIRARHVLLVDDIFDTGRTYARLAELMRERGASSVRGAFLLWKESRREVDILPDYFCFRIPDEFVVGYGLDYNDDFRHLPYIAVLEPHEQ